MVVVVFGTEDGFIVERIEKGVDVDDDFCCC